MYFLIFGLWLVFNGRVTTMDAVMHDAKLVPTRWTKMNVIDLYK